MSLHFDIEELKTFTLLAENGSFTETAQVLRISQPAVSQRIARLEGSFGLILFIRSAERAMLSPDGERVLSSARRCVQAHALMTSRIRHYHRESTGGIRLWIDRSVIGDKIAARIGEESGERCRVERIDCAAGPGWQQQLRTFECDLALSGVFLEGAVSPGIRKIELRREAGLTAIWSPEHYAFDKRTLHFDELLESVMILGSERLVPGFRSFVEDWCRRAYGTVPLEILEFDDCEAALHSCRSGFGVGLVPGDAAIRMNLRAERMESRELFSEVLPKAYTYALHLRADEDNPRVIAAAEWIEKIYRQVVGDEDAEASA